MSTPNKLHFNKPQLRSWLVGAHEEVAIWGRGTGKSEGLIAPRSADCVFAMPRSCGVFVAATYQQLLTRTLPPVIKGWEKLGYKRDRDFFFGQFAPKKWKWDLPFAPPLKPEYFIHWRNGAGIALVSQDRPGSANGLSIDWIAGDEAKYLKKDRYEQELLPANRGNRGHYGHLHQHHSILLCSDMPVATSGRWILKKEEAFSDPHNRDRIELVLAIQTRVYDLSRQLGSAKSPRQVSRFTAEIKKLVNSLAVIRKGNFKEGIPPLRFFSRASTLENIEVLGPEYIEQQKMNLTDINFRTSILNLEISGIEHGFYPDLDEEKHGYDDYDNSYLEGLNYNFEKAAHVDSRQDADVMISEPLDIALDYGASINCMCIGQPFDDEYRMLNAVYVKHPYKIRDLIKKFKAYYRHHRNKTVRFYYDHTAVGQNAANDVRYYREVVDELERKTEDGAWRVITRYIGHQPSHHARYEFWGKLLTDKLPNQPRFRFNRHNCENWQISCQLAPVKQGSRGFEKDKSSEKKTPGEEEYKVEQERATHFSDAGDTLIYGALNHGYQASGDVVDTLMG